MDLFDVGKEQARTDRFYETLLMKERRADRQAVYDFARTFSQFPISERGVYLAVRLAMPSNVLVKVDDERRIGRLIAVALRTRSDVRKDGRVWRCRPPQTICSEEHGRR